MPDYGHEYADKELKKLERKLTKEYQQAATEIGKKINAYFEQFEKQSLIKLQELQAGKITEKEYATWRANKILIGERWKEAQENITADLVNVDKIAAGMINDSLPLAYAENFNYGV